MTAKSRWDQALIVLLAAFFALSVAELFQLPALNDEIEHAHAAWLMAQGLRPYLDFFEQHTPAIWQALRLFYWVRPASGPEVLYWGRALGLLSLAASTALTGLLAFDATGSKRAALFASIVWTSLACVTDGVSIRPELLGLPLALAAFKLGSRAARRGRSVPLDSFLAGALASSACYCAPRAGLSIVALAAAWVWLARPAARSASAAAAGAALGTALAWYSIGPVGLRWVVGFAGHIAPPFSVLSYWSAYPGCWVVLMGTAAAALEAAKPSSRPARLLAWVLLASSIGPFLDRRPFAQTFAFMLPLAIVLAVSYLFKVWRSESRWRAPLTGVALALWLAPCALAHWIGWSEARAGASTLASQVESRADWSRRLAGETVLLPHQAHPIGVRDASYYWHGLLFLEAGTLEAAGLDSPKPDFYEDVLLRRPAMIDADFAKQMRAMDRTGRLDGLLRDDYVLLKNRRDAGGEGGVYWVRKDFVPKLASPQAK